MRLYPKVIVIGQSFDGVKNNVIPSQSMGLKEIIRRFVRRESLPMEKDGIYEENMGDLEKLAKQDLVIQHERIEELKRNLAEGQRRHDEKLKKDVENEKEKHGTAVNAKTKVKKSTSGASFGENSSKTSQKEKGNS